MVPPPNPPGAPPASQPFASAATRALLLRATAYHEAGHAVVAWRCGKPLLGGVRIRLDRPGTGSVLTPGYLIPPLAQVPAEQRPALLRRLRAECSELLAGSLAEARALGRRGAALAGDDTRRALLLLRHAHGCIDLVAELHLVVHVRATRRLLRRPEVWRAVTALAEQLIAHGAVGAGAAAALLRASGLAPLPSRYLAAGAAPTS